LLRLDAVFLPVLVISSRPSPSLRLPLPLRSTSTRPRSMNLLPLLLSKTQRLKAAAAPVSKPAELIEPAPAATPVVAAAA